MLTDTSAIQDQGYAIGIVEDNPILDDIKSAYYADPDRGKNDAWIRAADKCDKLQTRSDVIDWNLGDIGAWVASNGTYGTNALKAFAHDANVKVGRLRERVTVSRFYPFSVRQKIRAQMGDAWGLLRYSHFRKAMALKQDAISFLFECAENGWTTNVIDNIIKERRTGMIDERQTYLNAHGFVHGYTPLDRNMENEEGVLVMRISKGANWWGVQRALENKAEVVIIIRDAEPVAALGAAAAD